MAFKMKNPSIAKMVKMAGNNRTAMKMKAEEAAAMKMKKAAMKLKEEKAAMKLKEAAAMKMKSAMKLDKAKKGSYTTHGNPSKYTTASGETVSSANIDEGNLSTVKTGSDGRKFVVVQDATEKFKAGTKLYLPKDSAVKMKGDPKKAKTYGGPENNRGAAEKEDMKMEKKEMKTYPRRKLKMHKRPDLRVGKAAMKMKGDPKKEMTQAEKDAAIANAMPAAKKATLSKETVAGMKTYFGGVNADIAAVKLKIRQLKAKTERGASAKHQAKFDADLKEARRIAKARYPQHFR